MTNGTADVGARGEAMAATREPAISVVVASFRDVSLLDACLSSLREQCQTHQAELIVARASTADELELLGRRFPFAQFVMCPIGASVPELRGAGLSAARGDLVALTEDHCVAAPDWISQLVSGSHANVEIIGGAMRNAQRRRGIDWGAYFAEYGFFADAPANGDPYITGANVAYKRDAAREAAALASNGAWEDVIHGRFAEQGRPMRFVGSAIIAQNKNYDFISFCQDRFEHGRNYARARLQESGGRRRWVYLLGTLALPFLLMFRVARVNASHEPAAFIRALPFSFAFLSMWSIGEWFGYWRGAAPAQETYG